MMTTTTSNGRRKVQGIIDVDPTAGVKVGKQRKVKRHKRDSLKVEESQALLDLSSLSKRDRALVWLFMFTAARSVEVYRAKVEDLRVENKEYVLYVQGKGRTGNDKEPLYIADKVAQRIIREYLDELAERGYKSGPLFVTEQNHDGKPRGISRRTIRYIIKNALRKACGDKTSHTTHGLRHTAISTALKNGADLRDVQSMARHADINTTMIYVHEAERRERAAERKISYK